MKNSFLILFVILVCFLILGCPPPDDHPTTTTTTSSGNEYTIDDDIEGSVTWTSGNTYHIVADIYVLGNLTIQPGVTIKFDPGLWMDVQAGATMTAVGTSDDHIVFTSAGVQTPGAWRYLFLGTGSNATTLSYCDFFYAGNGDYYAVVFWDARASITNCTFTDNLLGGIDATYAATGTSTITGNAFYSNGDIPVIINTNCIFDATNIFHEEGQATSYVNNCVQFDGDISGSKTFDITEVPYYFKDSAYINGNLTINPGVVIKLDSDVYLDVFTGATLNAIGTSSDRIIFTSFKDDATLGDTNGDGATTGEKGDWEYLIMENNATTLTYCTFMYGGVGDNYVIVYWDASADIDNCILTHNLYGGIDAYYALAGSTITNNSASDNNADGVAIWDYYIDGNANVTYSGNTGLLKP